MTRSRPDDAFGLSSYRAKEAKPESKAAAKRRVKALKDRWRAEPEIDLDAFLPGTAPKPKAPGSR